MPSTPVASDLANAYSGTYYADTLAWVEHIGILPLSSDGFIPHAPAFRAAIANYLYLKSMPCMNEDTPLAAAGQLTISRQPQSMEPSGGMVTFKVEASGGQAPYTYTWEIKSNSTSWMRVYDSTSNTLTKYPTLDMIQSGLRFRCTIKDAAGNTVVSDEATVSSADTTSAESTDSLHPGVSNKPMYICSNLSDQSCRAGDMLKLSFNAGGGEPPFRYLWEYRTGSSAWRKFDGGSLKEATHYTPTQQELDDGLQIRVRAYDQDGWELSSRIASIRELDTPADGTLKIVSQPENTVASNYSEGALISYSVEVSGGTAPYQYQWQLLSTAEIVENNCGFTCITETPGGWATGYNSAQLHVPYLADMQKDNMKFCCVITDANGNSVVTKPVGFADGYVGPYITEDPRSTLYYPKLYDEVNETTTSEFSVEVIGGVLPYTYQWQYRPDGQSEFIDFTGAESSWAWDYNTENLTVLTFPDTPFAIPGYYRSPFYRCKITDAAGNYMYSQTAASIIYN